MAERPESSEALINGLVGRSVELAVFGGRRDFLKPGDLGKAIGTKDTMYIAAALHGQHRLNAGEAKQLAQALGIDADTAMATTAMPLRTDFPSPRTPSRTGSWSWSGSMGCPPGALE